MTPILSDLLDDFAARRALRAGSFIVTIYGDVVGPRGGSVSMASVIETCRLVGISETLARTAVSRLVEAGRLTGLREGRRSYYRLTPAAEAEFQAAARALHGDGASAEGAPWTFVLLPPETRAAASDALARRGFGAAGGVAAKPGDATTEARAALAALGPAAGGVILRGAPEVVGAGDLAAFAASAWNLAALSEAYAGFARRFAPLAAAMETGEAAGKEALALRLLLVHDFRHIALRDPGLPYSALPPDWAGGAARARFRSLYAALSPAAEAHVRTALVDVDGPLGAPAGWRDDAA